MSSLHINYQGWSTTVLFEEEHALLDRYINMDTGQMYYTIGKQIGGKSINPLGALGRRLIAVADYWIRNPDTKWSPHSTWSGALYPKDYPPFNYQGPPEFHPGKVQSRWLETVVWIVAFIVTAILFLTH